MLALGMALSQTFEYGEGLADLSDAELSFLAIFSVFEWRYLKRTRARGRTIRSSIFRQLTYLGTGFAVLMGIAFIRGASTLPQFTMGFLFLASISERDPRQPSNKRPVGAS